MGKKAPVSVNRSKYLKKTAGENSRVLDQAKRKLKPFIEITNKIDYVGQIAPAAPAIALKRAANRLEKIALKRLAKQQEKAFNK
jgi:hypothetical protein